MYIYIYIYIYIYMLRYIYIYIFFREFCGQIFGIARTRGHRFAFSNIRPNV